MAATIAPPVGGPSPPSTAAAKDSTSGVRRPLHLRLGVGRKEASPDGPFHESLSEDDSRGSDSPRSGPQTMTSFPCTQHSPPSSSQLAYLDEALPFSLSKFRERSNRAEAERRSRQWLSGTLALLGGVMAVFFAAYQLRFALPTLKKGSDSSVSAGSSRPYDSTSSPSGTGAAPPGVAGSIQEAVGSKVTLRRQWMFGIFAIALSIYSAMFVSKLHAWILGVRRWLHPKKHRLPLLTEVEEEFAELYSIKEESVNTKDDFGGADPLAITAIRKCLNDYRALSRGTHQSAFAIFFYLAAQSRRRQIDYSLYRKLCDALHAKVEQNRPILSEEVAEVLTRQRALRHKYCLMKDDITFVLREENLPPCLCQEELEFLTRDFRPALLELANHTIYSLDMDRRFIHAFVKVHSSSQNAWHEDENASDNTPKETAEQEDLPDSLQQREDQQAGEEENKTTAEDLTSESNNELAMHESQFWDARRTLSSYPFAGHDSRCTLIAPTSAEIPVLAGSAD
ncbi:hypothetical protein, conserved [Eimeria acervulina]|uniref:Transmembrane protein n=1 Tax=Eimeria acervulina TaxID=5801 RepID=U6GNU2_EIMAC|nr:hypothetical protein, conserved [Eimeria acervulina]CDI81886.1 hypothetical protein, conserved [Eimeria acervulina]